MPLPYKLTKESDIPTAFKDHYVKKGDVWVLDADGAVDAAELGEFRKNNIELLKLVGETDITKAKEKLARMKDVDPERYKKLVEDADLAEQKRLKEEGKLEEFHQQQTTALKTAHAKEVDRLTGETKTVQARLKTVMIDNALQAAAVEAGVQAKAIPDVLARGGKVFELDGDKVVAKREDGKPWFNDKAEALSIAEWFEFLAKDAPHLFGETKGAGGHGSPPKVPGYNAPNPFSKKSLNRTEQARVMRENKGLGERLKTLAEAEA